MDMDVAQLPIAQPEFRPLRLRPLELGGRNASRGRPPLRHGSAAPKRHADGRDARPPRTEQATRHLADRTLTRPGLRVPSSMRLDALVVVWRGASALLLRPGSGRPPRGAPAHGWLGDEQREFSRRQRLAPASVAKRPRREADHSRLSPRDLAEPAVRHFPGRGPSMAGLGSAPSDSVQGRGAKRGRRGSCGCSAAEARRTVAIFFGTSLLTSAGPALTYCAPPGKSSITSVCRSFVGSRARTGWDPRCS